MNELKKNVPMPEAPAQAGPGHRDVVPVDAGAATPAGETGGPAGLEPTRYGDWERRGRCIDF